MHFSTIRQTQFMQCIHILTVYSSIQVPCCHTVDTEQGRHVASDSMPATQTIGIKHFKADQITVSRILPKLLRHACILHLEQVQASLRLTTAEVVTNGPMLPTLNPLIRKSGRPSTTEPKSTEFHEPPVPAAALGDRDLVKRAVETFWHSPQSASTSRVHREARSLGTSGISPKHSSEAKEDLMLQALHLLQAWCHHQSLKAQTPNSAAPSGCSPRVASEFGGGVSFWVPGLVCLLRENLECSGISGHGLSQFTSPNQL